jgi:hypothetical protein
MLPFTSSRRRGEAWETDQKSFFPPLVHHPRFCDQGCPPARPMPAPHLLRPTWQSQCRLGLALSTLDPWVGLFKGTGKPEPLEYGSPALGRGA